MLAMCQPAKILILVLAFLFAGPGNTTFAAKRGLQGECHDPVPMASQAVMACCAGMAAEVAHCPPPADHGEQGPALCCLGVDCFASVPGESGLPVGKLRFAAVVSYPLPLVFSGQPLMSEDVSCSLPPPLIPGDIYIRNCVFLI